MIRLDQSQILSLFAVQFERVINSIGWKVKTFKRSQPKHGLWQSNVKAGKYLAQG